MIYQENDGDDKVNNSQTLKPGKNNYMTRVSNSQHYKTHD